MKERIKKLIRKLIRKTARFARPINDFFGYAFRRGWTPENTTAAIIGGVIVAMAITVWMLAYGPLSKPEITRQAKVYPSQSTVPVSQPAVLPRLQQIAPVPTRAPKQEPKPEVVKPRSAEPMRKAEVVLAQAPTPEPSSDEVPHAPKLEDLPAVSGETCAPRKYTPVRGQTLGQLAIDVYGEGQYWNFLYVAEETGIKNPNLIYAGKGAKELLFPTCIDNMPSIAELAKKYAPIMSGTVSETETATTPAVAPEATPLMPAPGTIIQAGNVKVKVLYYGDAPASAQSTASSMETSASPLEMSPLSNEFGRCSDPASRGRIIPPLSHFDVSVASRVGSQ
jgi:hypothetical protein